VTTAAPSRLRLRPGVQILRAGPREFLVLNPGTGAQLTCAAEERYLIHLLERCESLDSVRDAFERRFGAGLAERALQEFVEQLRTLDLVVEQAEPVLEPPTQVSLPPARPPAPLSAADPGASVNRFFDHLALLFGWLVHPLSIAIIAALFVVAITALVQRWELVAPSLLEPRQGLPALWLLLLMPAQAMLVLSLPISLLTGIVCRLYGARIRQFGLGMYERVWPHFYCDCGDAAPAMKDRGQWTLAAVPIGSTLAIGSVAAIGWAMCKPGSLLASFLIGLLVPCTVGLLFHCLPFFQGSVYWMICKRLEDWRLLERALAETRAWLGWRRSPEALTADERYWLRAYGLSYYLFRIVFDTVVVVGLGYLVFQRFNGPGALVYSAFILYWYRSLLEKTVMASWSWLVRGGGPWWVRWPLRLGLVAGVVALGFVPYSHEIVGECRLIPQMQHGVRAQLTDEITEVHVKEGDIVPCGAVIATLSGRTVRESYLATKAELEKAQAHRDLLRAGFRPEDIKIAQERLQVVQVSVNYYEEQMKREERLLASSAASREQYDRYKREHDVFQERLLLARENLNKLQSGYREEEIRAAEAAVRVQQERLKYYQELLTLTKVVTPLGGRVVTPYLEQKRGQTVKAGELLAVLQDPSALHVEVAAEDSAAANVRPGMRAHVRLYSQNGRLLNGRVQRVAHTAEQDRAIGIAPVRTEPEAHHEQLMNNRARSNSNYHVRVYLELEDCPEGLRPDMTGYARIVVNADDVLWKALVRPVARFLRTEVWSWLP
jgi:membrane fusion protein YbhG